MNELIEKIRLELEESINDFLVKSKLNEFSLITNITFNVEHKRKIETSVSKKKYFVSAETEVTNLIIDFESK